MRTMSYFGYLLLAGSLLACGEDMAPQADPCTGRRTADVSVADGHRHTVHLCEEDRDKSVLFSMTSFDHAHNMGLTATEVNSVLNGESFGRGSPSSDGHAHFVNFAETQ